MRFLSRRIDWMFIYFWCDEIVLLFTSISSDIIEMTLAIAWRWHIFSISDDSNCHCQTQFHCRCHKEKREENETKSYHFHVTAPTGIRCNCVGEAPYTNNRNGHEINWEIWWTWRRHLRIRKFYWFRFRWCDVMIVSFVFASKCTLINFNRSGRVIYDIFVVDFFTRCLSPAHRLHYAAVVVVRGNWDAERWYSSHKTKQKTFYDTSYNSLNQILQSEPLQSLSLTLYMRRCYGNRWMAAMATATIAIAWQVVTIHVHQFGCVAERPEKFPKNWHITNEWISFILSLIWCVIYVVL